MAWDKDRPYAPFTVFREGTTPYKRGEREQMEQYANVVPTKGDIDLIYKNGSLKDDVWHSLEFRPLNKVELTLTYEGFGRGRSAVTFFWRDENNVRYPMFATEIDRLLRYGLLENVMHGYWSAEKRGSNYGVKLVRLAEEGQ